MSEQRTAAIVLAAGLSSRMGTHKLLMVAQGGAMVSACVDRLLASSADEVWVVTGHESEAIRRVLAGRAVRYVHCSDFAQGMGRSLAAGVSALDEDVVGALICLADMPRVSTQVVNALIDKFKTGECASIVIPTYHGRRGHPVVFPRVLFPELCSLKGDMGAREVVQQNSKRILEFAVDCEGVLLDVDDLPSAQSMGFEVNK